jgi:gamma-glutamylputrescine oxidase
MDCEDRPADARRSGTLHLEGYKLTQSTPYWWDGHRPDATSPLPDSCDTLIVGGGQTGIVTAIELARAGQSVTVIESNHVGAGATGRSMGVLSTPAAGAGFGDPDEQVHGRPRKAWHRERLAAQHYLLRLIEESGADCDLQEGVVLLAPSQSNYRMLADTVETRNALYGTGDYALSQDELEAEAGGNVSNLFAGALVLRNAHHVQPAKMITGLATLAKNLGTTICERTEVVGLQRGKNGTRVQTNGGEVLAQNVLLTTGGYTTDFDGFLWKRTLGVPSIVATSEELPREGVAEMFPSGRVLLVNRIRSYCCRPSPDGCRLIMAGPLAQVPRSADDNIQTLKNYFKRLFPEVESMEFTHSWTGMIAATRDAQGHSGAHNDTWYSVGASGLVSCADAGRRMAQNILHADGHAAAADTHFPRWPLRDSEHLLWRGIALSAGLLDLVGKSRLR